MVFIYAFISVICLGIAPFFGKYMINIVNPLTAFALRSIIAAFLILIWGINYQNFIELKHLPITFWVCVTFEAILAVILADLAYFYALEKGRIGQVALIISCAPLVTILTGYAIFDEEISYKQLIGAFFITCGLIIINFDR